ncbi:MAG: hypothetical protein RLZZ129_86 [Verrucomicrobiota bacterium]|jgi:hypothetical protein
MPRLRFLLPLLLGCLPAAQATSVIAPDFENLVARTDYTVRVEVVAVSSSWRENPEDPAQRYIGTSVELRVLEVITGQPPSPLILEVMGGQVGPDVMTVEGAPVFRVGEESILFVQGNGRQVVPLTAMMHGFYPVRRDARTGEARVLRCNGKLVYSEHDVMLPLGATSGVVMRNPRAKPLTAADFTARIRQTAAALAEREAPELLH